VVWAGGVRVSPLVENLKVEKTDHGLIVVKPTLQLPSHANIFAIGDIASLMTLLLPLRERRNSPYRKPACSRETSKHFLSGEELETKHFEELGEAVSLGTERAAVLVGGKTFAGPLARQARFALYTSRLPTWHHRLRVGASWFFEGTAPRPLCRWEFKGDCGGADSDKPCSNTGASNNHCGVCCLSHLLLAGNQKFELSRRCEQFSRNRESYRLCVGNCFAAFNSLHGFAWSDGVRNAKPWCGPARGFRVVSPSSPESTQSTKDSILSGSFVGTLHLIIRGRVKPEQLQDTFTAARSEGRTHDAIDIMAPAGTPSWRERRRIVRLFQSDRGGTTIYQLSPDKKLVFYYAHLQRYADGLVTGKFARQVK